MKNIIFDTDIGVDCDDACALALLLNYAKENKCIVDTITTSTTRVGAVSTVRAIADYYDHQNYVVGKMSLPAIEADSMNSYAKAVYDCFLKSDEPDDDAVSIIRAKLARSNDNEITLICVGPLSNIGRLLKSKPDKYSPLNGQELVDKKVKEAYLMAGIFKEQTGFENIISGAHSPYEWNVCQDIENAIITVESLKCPIYFLPGEVGLQVECGLSTKNDKSSPVWKSVVSYGKSIGVVDKNLKDEDVIYQRFSWDPLTVMYAIEGNNKYLEVSKCGKATINKDGSSSFVYDDSSNHYVIRLKHDANVKEELSDYLNKHIKR